MSYAIVSVIYGTTCRDIETIVDEMYDWEYDHLMKMVEPLNIQTPYSASGGPSPCYIGWELTALDSYENENWVELNTRVQHARAAIPKEDIEALEKKINELPPKLRQLLGIKLPLRTFTFWSDS